MDENDFSKNIEKLRDDFQSNLNDIYIWSSVATDALQQVSRDDAFLNHKVFIVPSVNAKNSRAIESEPERVLQIINNALNYELYYSVLVYLVAQVESFLNDVVAIVLRFDHRRLLISIQGVESVKKIDVAEIVSNNSKEAVINVIIKQQLISLFYAGPASQFEYMKKAIGIALDENTQNKWIELKATRDLIVHNYGIVNDVYLKKCNNFARGTLGEKTGVDKKYFESSIANAKSLIGKIALQIQRSMKKDLKTLQQKQANDAF